MTTAVDSNVLIDVIGQPNNFTAAGVAALDTALHAGALIVCPVVVAEIAVYFSSDQALQRAFDSMHLEMRPFTWADLHRAGKAYVTYCRRSREPRKRMLADFLIAAHAVTHADGLLTRDRGYYQTCFSELRLVEP